MFVAECVESRECYKPNQKDDDGNPLPLGSMQFRIGSHQSNLGQIRNIWARPANFVKRHPLIGEQCILINAPVNDWTTSGLKQTGYLYLTVLNSTDDLVLHQFPKLWKRTGRQGGSAGERKSDKEEPGYTFPKKPKRTDNIQPFEGDDLFEGRFGQSIRFGSTVEGDMSIYDKKPNWKGGANTDPIIITRVKKPTGGTSNTVNSATLNNQSTNKYTIEDIESDESSVYMTTTQMIQKLKAGFSKNTDAKQLGSYKTTSQVIVNSGRVVINATKDKAFVIGKEKVIITGKKVLFQSDKYKVDLDDLMDFLKDWLKLDVDLASGKAQYSTAAGPTSISTNLSQYLKLQTGDFQKFKTP